MNKTTVPVDVEIIDEPASKKSRFGSETVSQSKFCFLIISIPLVFILI